MQQELPTTNVSEQDQQAFLETLAAVRHKSQFQPYDKGFTHLPTLIVTGILALAGAGLFCWWTAPEKGKRRPPSERHQQDRHEQPRTWR
jgi:hypothetical protein